MATVTRERELLRELVALVRGECPSLLNEDSGGDVRLSMAIDDALAAPPAEDGSVMVRVDAMFVEQMRAGGLQGPFSRIELDETGTEPRLMLTVQREPTPDSVEWWRSVAAGLGVEIQKLKDLAAQAPPASDPPGLASLKDVADKLMALPVEESVDWHCLVIPRQQALRIVYDAVCPLRTPTADDKAWARAVMDVAYPLPASPQAETTKGDE